MSSDRVAVIQRILRDIHDDMANDAARFDGQPFTGRTVAEYFGCQGAAIAALANIVAEVVEVLQAESERKVTS